MTAHRHGSGVQGIWPRSQTQVESLWGECAALRLALRRLIEVLEEPMRQELLADHYERLEEAVRKAKEIA